MFYIIETQEQLNNLNNLEDCFIHFIGNNDNFHPKLQELSLIYLRPLNNHKGYILSIKHNEAFSLDINSINSFLSNCTNKLYTLNKKYSMYFYDNFKKLYDIQFIKHYNIINEEVCYNYFYNKYPNVNNVNNIIPISKLYEYYENIFYEIHDIIKLFNEDDEIYKFNNNETTEAFWKLESNGIKLNKNEYIKYFGNKNKYPEFNIKNSKIYTSYNLYTLTSRPSNHFNNINFSSLQKENGEREAFTYENSYLIEFDFTAFHPNLAAKLCKLSLPEVISIYEWLNMEKKEVFNNLYGGITPNNLKHIYFKTINDWIIKIYNENKSYKTKNREFIWSRDKIDNMNKMLSYILQSYETYYGVLIINKISDYLKNKKSKLILSTFDSFLIDYHIDDGDIKNDIKNIMEFPSKIKTGTNYNNLVSQNS